MDIVHRRCVKALALICVALAAACTPTGNASQTSASAASDTTLPTAVQLTWLSVTNWLVEAGDTRLLLDGYVTRVDRRRVGPDGFSTGPAAIDRTSLARIVDAVVPARRLDWILVGHGHWDHAFDTPGWAALTNARVGGSRTVCHQVVALGVDASRCTAVEGGEIIDVSPTVRVRVVRWHHSGDTSANGRRLRAPLELRGPPRPDRATGGLRPGFLEDYPNGGGSRAYLITVRTRSGPVTLFWSNTGNPEAWDVPIPVDSALLRQPGVDLSRFEWAPSREPTRDALAAAMRAEGLSGVAVWLGWPGLAHVQQVASVLRPTAFIPHHWDDFWEPIENGVQRGYSAPAVTSALSSAGVRSIAPSNYFDRFRVETSGVTPEGDAGVRARLGVRQ
jgi:L-ascorbate metabolism protein UlaG (beta-lactamase superfamily)